jgi:hypothetical protein
MATIPDRRLGALIVTRSGFGLISTKKHLKMAAVFYVSTPAAWLFAGRDDQLRLGDSSANVFGRGDGLLLVAVSEVD